jgi:hypothetical protein
MAPCPRCGFTYAWDGTTCGHCRFPSDPAAQTDADQDDQIQARILTKVRKHGLPGGRTHRFDDLEAGYREAIQNLASTHLQGRPILVFMDSLTRWTLLSTREVICHERGELRKVALRELTSVENAPDSEFPSGGTDEEIGRWKGSWEYLRLTDGTRRVVLIWVPCGGEAYAVWNILLPYARTGR